MKKSSKKQSKKKSSRTSSIKSSRKSSKKTIGKNGGTADNEKIVKTYIENLDKQLKEKDLYSFCVFPEQGFKNKMREDIKDIKKLIKKEAGKHDHLVCILINPLHNRRESISGKAGVWLFASINVIPIDEKGELLSKKGWNTDMHWKVDDFKITKFSLKLLETLMKHVIKKKLGIAGVFGVPFNELVKRLGYKDVDISSVFTPLPDLV